MQRRTSRLTLRSLSVLVFWAIFAALSPLLLHTQSVYAQAETLPAPALTAEATDAVSVTHPDSEALAALYRATDGANWLGNAPLASWHGVTTGDNGRVVELYPSENGLSGEIPPELGNLTNLTVLTLAGNESRGCVPAGWRSIESNDLNNLGLPFCSASPATLPPAPPATPSPDDESTLNTPVEMPRAMLYAAYAWPAGTAMDEILVSFTVDNDVELAGDHGLYFIACTAFSIAGDDAYFGLQTDVSAPARGNLGKGAIFSRWYENDETAEVRLADTRVPESGWTESGDYEGNFVSVRGRYRWGGGDYTIKVAAQEADNVGRWYGLWVIDGNGKETWIGSLRFSPGARIDPACYSTVEVYGGPPLKPADLPYWKVSMNPPTGNGIPTALVDTWYPQNVGSLRNALITVNGARVTFEVGLAYIAHD